MAFIFCDGFDRASSTAALVQDIDWAYKWRTSAAPASVSGQASSGKNCAQPAPTGGVNGGMAIYHLRNNSAGNRIFQYILPSHRAGVGNTLFTSLWIKPENRPNSDAYGGFLHFCNDGNTARVWGGTVPVPNGSGYTLLSLGMKTTGVLELRRDNTVVATGTAVCALSAYVHIEIAFTNIDDSGANCTVKVNGTTDINFTGDLYGAGTKGLNGIAIATTYNSLGFSFWVDDVIIWDSSGSAFNASMAPKLIFTRAPNGNGSHLDGTPSSGTNYQTQDDTDMNSAISDYNTIAGTDAYDLFTFADLPSGVTDIAAVVVSTLVGTLGVASREVGNVVLSGSSPLVTSNAMTVPVGSIGTAQGAFATDPNTSAAWTKSGVDSAEFGYKLVS